MTHRYRVPDSTEGRTRPSAVVETSGAMGRPEHVRPSMMDASNTTSPRGESASGTDYDQEARLWKFVENHADLLADLAHKATDVDDGRRLHHADDLEEAAETWRQLSREAAFYADVIDELRSEGDGEP